MMYCLVLVKGKFVTYYLLLGLPCSSKSLRVKQCDLTYYYFFYNKMFAFGVLPSFICGYDGFGRGIR